MIDNNSSHRSVLAICRDVAAFYSLLSEKSLNLSDTVIASDDLSVHVLVKEHEKLQVAFFDQMEPYFDIAPYVLSELGAINRWLNNLGDNNLLPKDILYWEQHVEGGDEAQRIQDAIIEARACFAIFDRFSPLKVIIGAGYKTYWEDVVLTECAKQRNITIHKLKNFNLKRIWVDLWQRLRPIAKEIYRSIMTIDAIFRRKASGYGTCDFGEYVAIQLCSDAPKHLNHTLPLIESFEKEGFKTVAVTCDIGWYAKTLRKQGYKVAELEAWTPINSLYRSWMAIIKGLLRARENAETFLPKCEGSDYSSLIRPALLLSVRNFFLSEVAYRIRLEAACKGFFSENPPVASRLWTRTLFQGVIAYRAMTEKKPLLMWHALFSPLPWPYEKHDIPVDVIFCQSPYQRNGFRKDSQCNLAQIHVVGAHWLSRVKNYYLNHLKNNKLRPIIGTSRTVDFVIFLDTQFIIRGYCSAREQFLIAKTVIEFAETNENVVAILKPHAADKTFKIKKIFEKRGRGRVVWMPNNVLAYDCINAADVVLTKHSTLALEAMVLAKPSICVLLDKDKRWTLYEDAVDYAFSIDELSNKLEMLQDKKHYSSWFKALRKRQLEYMERHLPEPKIECSDLMARKVKAALNIKDKKS